MDSAITQLRGRCTIAWAWEMLGLPGRPSKHCRSPFRDDLRPSFSVYKAGDGERWFDHGEAIGGDVVDLWARAKGLSVKEALTDILRVVPSMEASNRPLEAVLPREGIFWPDNLQEPTSQECEALGALRGLSPEAFFLAGRLGTLLMGDKRGQRIWMTCDKRMRSAAMRRLDGKNLILIDKKSASPKNAKRDWLIGTQTRNSGLDALKRIVVVEGEGDYYAALQLSIESEISFKVLAILGASVKSFHKGCQAQFKGALVLISPHNDLNEIGRKAAIEWVGLFYSWGAAKVTIQAIPFEHNDLADVLKFSPDQASHLLKGFHERTDPRT